MDKLCEKRVPCSSDSAEHDNTDTEMQTNKIESIVDNIDEIESESSTTFTNDKKIESVPILAMDNSMDCSLEICEKVALMEEVYPSCDLVPSDTLGQKRKTESEVDETPEVKKHLNSLSDEKKIVNLRKNIRDVMDENQLDTNTIAAQREESERLARVAEQQKIIREHQRQAAVNRQFVRTQNRVLSLLQSGNTFAKVTEEDTFNEDTSSVCESADISTASTVLAASKEKSLSIECDVKSEIDAKEILLNTENLDVTQTEHHITSDVVTIEDSSSEDDCILLSDDEEDLEEEIEDDPTNSGLHVKDTYNVPDELGRVVVNIGHPDGEDDIFIAPQIARIIKPHQIGGVRFLFDNIIESTNRFKSSSGFGCILSHSMGLGKTLQVVCFCDIFLRHTLSKTVLCVMPINTLQNWVSEFNMWIPKVSDDSEKVRPRKFDVYVLNDQQKTLSARAKVILKWSEEGGVLLIGYELFRLLALKLIQKRKRRNNKMLHSDNSGSESNRRLMESINQALVKPGPDLVICDEGHRIKNAHAGISLALKQIRTRRRIVLTGYPLQNNLLEYWCMVDFVRPNYLGTRTEFCNMFERPIQNGQCIDSTPEDIKLMRYRAHVLHSLLVGFVQRRSHTVLQQTLPQKLEYVILARMTAFQRRLYDTFMNDIVRSKTVPNPLKAFAVCCKIWNHPDVLYNFLKKRETDLDLEIEDGEVMNEIGSTESVNNTKNKIDEIRLSATNESKPLPTSSDTNTSQSKTSGDDLIGHSNMNSQNVMESLNSRGPEYSNLTSNYNNIYFSDNYCQQNNQMGYSSNCGGNNYWPESNVPYFGYQQAPTNIEYSSSKPNYVGIMVNEKYEQSTNQPHNLTSSSEIVDLDTKEIKTVETDINMSRNPVIKNEIAEEKPDSSEKTNSNLNETPVGTITSSNNSQDLNNMKQNSNLPTSGLEKEHLKIKSDDGILHEWAIEFMKKYQPGIISNSPKMEILFCILNESIQMGDRVLVFSQSLLTLNLIETFLQSNYIPDSDTRWSRNVSYFRLDGSTTSQEREKLVNEFNSNINVKLFLISTRAGSLGINLVGANRVVVFDASWNPCHDTQAVYRIYRYGQTKACFVYRIVMDKCLEKKIYDRQIKKQGMADRVVDECNPEAHLSIRDITNLCHDYDDDKRESDSSSFLKPLESYMDLIVQKLVERHKDCLSKEPFYHDSLLVDRKEKKLSQAEKRQAHRGYELEKKASVKNTLTTTNKIQYRIVRNDGTVITRPVASIRPMQTTTKSQNFMKTGGLRTTRWIPAEVWQRQGMTAQEMTLPLDVVIPTHSNDKSNIILKSGQRVMVLKSAKGIYMQLESGKIIAIRTTTKANETNKSDKDEVIDITSETDTTFEAKNNTMKQVTHNQTTSNFTKEGTQSDNNEGDTTEYNSVKEKEYTDLSPKKSKDNSHENTTTDIKRSSLSPLRNCSSMHSLGKSGAKNNVGPFVKKKLPSYVNSSYEPSKNILNHSSNNNQSSLRHQTQIESALLKSNINNKQSLLQCHAKEVKKSFQDVSNKNSIRNQVTKINTPRDTYSSEINPIIPITMRQENPLPQISKMHQMHSKGSSLHMQTSNAYIGGNTSELPKHSPSHQRKGELNMPPDSFQNTFSCKPNNDSKSPPGTRLTQAERLTTQCHSPQNSQVHLAEPVQYSQYPLFSQHSQKQQQPKAHPYMPSYDIEHPQCNNSMSLTHMSTPQYVNPESTVANNLFVPNVANDSSLHHSESNSILTSCEYPTQFVDYPNYNSYNHPHYFSHFHSNTYGNSPSPNISSNPYHMHWPPLVAPAPIHEQCNAMCAPTCTQNGTQSNQWHHKL